MKIIIFSQQLPTLKSFHKSENIFPWRFIIIHFPLKSLNNFHFTNLCKFLCLTWKNTKERENKVLFKKKLS